MMANYRSAGPVGRKQASAFPLVGAGLALLLLAVLTPLAVAAAPSQFTRPVPPTQRDGRPVSAAHAIHLPLLITSGDNAAIFFDSFDDPTSGWWIGDNGDAAWSYGDSDYEILIRADTYWAAALAPLRGIDNYAVETDVRWHTASDGGHGLTFGWQDQGHFFLFAINPQRGEFTVWKAVAGGWSRPIDWTSTSAIAPAPVTNRLRVNRSGPHIEFYVNDQQVGELEDDSYIGLYVGVIAFTGATAPAAARFDNFVVWDREEARREVGPGRMTPGLSGQSPPRWGAAPLP